MSTITFSVSIHFLNFLHFISESSELHIILPNCLSSYIHLEAALLSKIRRAIKERNTPFLEKMHKH